MLPRSACILFLAASVLQAADLTPAERQLNLESFDRVWTTVRDRHWDPGYNGVNWQAAREEFRPQVERAASIAEARNAMQAMLARLKQTHFGIFPADAYQELGAKRPGDATPGIDVRLIENRVIITLVEAGSPAARAGLKPGWELRSVDGKDLGPAVEKLKAGILPPALLIRTMLRARLEGPAGQAVKLGVSDGEGKTRSIDVDRVQPRGVRTVFGNLPARYVSVESRRAAPKTGYVAFSMFLDPENVMRAVADAVASCHDCNGIIIDLRGNPGGLGGMAMGMAGFFVETAGKKLGTMVMRDNKLLFAVSPRPRTFDGRLAILVDECSASTSEIFAEGMKDLGRARIFGSRTAGAALPSAIEKLPNGDGFQYAFADYISEAGKRLEGAGVAPDVDAPLTRKALLENRDPALEAAVEWIESAPKKG